MFVLVTYKPDTENARENVVSIIGKDNRAYHPLKGTAYIVQVRTVPDARKIQKELEAVHQADADFDYNWFRINPVTTGYYYPEKEEQRDSWANFKFYKGILKKG